MPTDSDGLPIYPTQTMCLADLRDNLKEAEHSTPLIDRDWVAQGDPYGNSKAAHCQLENAQRARCVPYVKGKYVSPDGPDYVCPWDK